MQYLVSVIDESPTWPPPDEDAAIDVFNDRLKAGGHWVFAGGLEAPGTAHGHRQPRRAGAGDRRVEGLQPEGRGPAVSRRVSVTGSGDAGEIG